MPRRPLQDRQLRALLARLEPELRAAFEAAIADLVNGVDLPRLKAALEAQDIFGAIDALNIEAAAFIRYSQVMTAGFAEAGMITAATIRTPTGATVAVRFDMTNPMAARWVREFSSTRITAVADSIRAAAREAIGSGYAAGRHPFDIARDLVGRSVRGAARQGGIIGLDGPRAERLLAVARGMETAEGVQGLVRGGRVRYAVNPATERRILRAYASGAAVPPAERALSVRQYSNALLKARGDTIARTETAQGVMAARREAWVQALDRTNYPPEAVLKTFIHGGHVKAPRHHHVEMSGQTVRGLDAYFEFSNGSRMRWAHDADAPASEVIGCGCTTEFRLDPRFGLEDVA